MPEEIIYCPTCSHKLRVPEELLGQIVQCPLCHMVFPTPVRGGTAPRPTFPPPQSPALREAPPPVPPPPREYPPRDWPPPRDAREQARGEVLPPAVGLIVVGGLGVLVNLLQIGICLFLPDLVRTMQPLGDGASATVALVAGTVFLLVSLGVLAAGIAMAAGRLYGLALLGSVLAMLNIGNLCCLLGLPAGIWALVVLQRSYVRDAFQ